MKIISISIHYKLLKLSLLLNCSKLTRFFYSLRSFYSPDFIPVPVHLWLFHIHTLNPLHAHLQRLALPPPPPDLLTPWGLHSLLRVRCISSHRDQTRQTSAVYVSGTSHRLVYAESVWEISIPYPIPDCLLFLKKSPNFNWLIWMYLMWTP